MSDKTEAPSAPRDHGRFRAGTRVQVRCRFDASWADGFEVVGSVAEVPGAYRIRRRSDGVELPDPFDADALRADDDQALAPADWARRTSER